jgi:hypothetical protein
MPWGPSDAARHTRKANSAKKKRQWAHVADSMLKRTGNESSAIRAANAAVAKSGRGSKKRKHGRRGGR